MAKKIIKARLKQRTDTQANWAANNPVLLKGELGLVTDDKNLYKVGDGVTAWNDLPFRGFDGTLVHETGDSDNAAMSQRGVTQALDKLKESMVEKVPGKGLSTEDYTTEEKRKLEGLQNFNDTEIQAKLTQLATELIELSAEKEDKANKVTSLTDESTDEQYPSAKAVYDLKERISENEVLIEDLQNTKIDKEADDYYPQLSVGVADNLAGHEDATPSEIGFRRSGGGAITDGVARVQSIKGNSVVWNQLFFGFIPNSETGTTITQLSNGLYRVEVEQGTNYGGVALRRKADYEVGHKYAVALELISSVGLNFNAFGEKRNGLTQGMEFICTATTSALTLLVPSATIAAQAVSFDAGLRITDLTKMFGAGNEPTTIEEFNARIPMGVDLNAYNKGEVIHNATDKIESVGVNQWDEEWELGEILQNGTPISSQTAIRSKNFNPIIESRAYNFHAIDARILIYDKNYTFIDFWSNGASGNREFWIPQGSSYFKISSTSNYGGVYKGDICINLSDPSVNRKYFPYVKREQNLDIIGKYFPNGMKSAGNAHDEIRYNKTTQKWEKVQRIGEVDLGTLDWRYIDYESSIGKTFTGSRISAVNIPNRVLHICAKYTPMRASIIYADLDIDKIIAIEDGFQVRVRDSAYTDAASFKAAMAGVMLYYELAEPIVTEIEETFNLDYPVWNVGTEKASANVPSTPLKADIIYGFNAYGVIKELLARVASLEAANASLASQLASVTSHNEEV